MEIKDIQFRKITLPEDFAERVIQRIDEENNRLLPAMNGGARFLLLTTLLVVNIATGILIGLKADGIKISGLLRSEEKKELIEFRDVHHLYSLRPIDRLFAPTPGG